MHAPDEYDELRELAAQASQDTPWRDLPRPFDLTPELVMQWITGRVRFFLERLIDTSAASYVFPDLGFPTPLFVQLEWPPPRLDENLTIHVGAHSGCKEERRGDFREALCAAAMLTVWSNEPKYAVWRTPGGMLDYLRYQIEKRPLDVVQTIDVALGRFGPMTEFDIHVVPGYRKGGTIREATDRLIGEVSRQRTSQPTMPRPNVGRQPLGGESSLVDDLAGLANEVEAWARKWPCTVPPGWDEKFRRVKERLEDEGFEPRAKRLWETYNYTRALMRTIERSPNPSERAIQVVKELVGVIRRSGDVLTQRTNPAAGTPKAPEPTQFTFRPGQALYGDVDLGLPAGLAVEVLQELVASFGLCVSHEDLDTNSSPHDASDQLREAVRLIRKALKRHSIPHEIDLKKGEGYVIQTAPRSAHKEPTKSSRK